MRRFLITSPKFTGTIELWYNFEGLISKVDMNDSALDFHQLKYLLHNLSPDIVQFQGLLTGSNLEIKEVPFELSLDDFKREYPYSRNYHLLQPIWHTMSAKDRVFAFFAAIQYRQYCERNKTWYKPKIAASWLQKKEFKNDWREM